MIFSLESLLSAERRVKLMQSTTTTQFDQIAMELLETERCYVNDLSDVIQVKAVFRVAALIVSRVLFCNS